MSHRWGGAPQQGWSLTCTDLLKVWSSRGLPYTDANKKKGVEWTEQNLSDYLEEQEVHSGTKMAFGGLKKAKIANEDYLLGFSHQVEIVKCI